MHTARVYLFAPEELKMDIDLTKIYIFDCFKNVGMYSFVEKENFISAYFLFSLFYFEFQQPYNQ